MRIARAPYRAIALATAVLLPGATGSAFRTRFARVVWAAGLAPQAAAPAPTQAEEKPAIQMVLEAYQTAYSQKNIDAIRRVFPTVNTDAYESSFSRVVTVTARIIEPDITVTGNRAIVVARLSLVITPTVGRPARKTDSVRLLMQKTTTGWIIDRFCDRNCP